MKTLRLGHLLVHCLITVAALAVAGCATQLIDESRQLQGQGKYEEAFLKISEAQSRYPESVPVRLAAQQIKTQSMERLLGAAQTELAAGNGKAAEQLVQRVLALDPGNDRATALSRTVKTDARLKETATRANALLEQGNVDAARQMVDSGLREAPRQRELLQLRLKIQDADKRREATTPRLAETRPISLSFRDANLRMVLEALSRNSGVNFVLDRDIRADARATIFVRNTLLEDAIDLLTSTNQLAKKILDPTTVLIYPNTLEKQKEYQDLVVRGFYLSNVDAKQTATLLRSMLKLREVFIDEKLNLIVIREPAETVRLAEQLVAMHDIGDAEVMLELEVLEVKTSRLLDLGILFPDSFSLTPLNAAGGTSLTVDDLRNLNSSRIGVTIPSVGVNLSRVVGDANLLANPRVRARNREKARILIGDKVPVITSTATATGFVAENVSYLEVGLKLEVEPTVFPDDQVSIKVNLEVSSLTREVPTRSGSLAYQIGTRNASTVLRLREGETQLLAGLINREERSTSNRVPGLGDLPIAGRLFSSQRDSADRTEIVLSITPRLIRPIARPDVQGMEFYSGTETNHRIRQIVASQPTRSAAPPPDSQPRPAGGSTDQSSETGQQPSTAAMLPPPAELNPAPTLTLIGPARMKTGEQSVIEVRVESAAALRALPIQLAYDATALEVLAVEEGAFFKGGGGATGFSHRIAPDQGRVMIGLTREGDQGAKGADVMVRVRIRAKHAGSVAVGIASAVPIAVSGPVSSPALPQPLRITID